MNTCISILLILGMFNYVELEKVMSSLSQYSGLVKLGVQVPSLQDLPSIEAKLVPSKDLELLDESPDFQTFHWP